MVILAIIFLLFFSAWMYGRMRLEDKKHLPPELPRTPHPRASPREEPREGTRGNSDGTGGRRYSTELKGVTHENDDGTSRQDLIQSLNPGEYLQLIPDPANPFDKDAVRVIRSDGKIVGYLPAHGDVARKLSLGWEFKTRVDSIYRLQHDSRRGVMLEIEAIPPKT